MSNAGTRCAYRSNGPTQMTACETTQTVGSAQEETHIAGGGGGDGGRAEAAAG